MYESVGYREPPATSSSLASAVFGVDPATLYNAAVSVARRADHGPDGLGGRLLDDRNGFATTDLAAIASHALARAILGAYVGSKLGRPVAGALVTAAFGPLGLGVLSFWKK